MITTGNQAKILIVGIGDNVLSSRISLNLSKATQPAPVIQLDWMNEDSTDFRTLDQHLAKMKKNFDVGVFLNLHPNKERSFLGLSLLCHMFTVSQQQLHSGECKIFYFDAHPNIYVTRLNDLSRGIARNLLIRPEVDEQGILAVLTDYFDNKLPVPSAPPPAIPEESSEELMERLCSTSPG